MKKEVLLIVTSESQIIECYANLTEVQREELGRLITADEAQVTGMRVQNLRVLISTKSEGVVILTALQ
jgi:hypothetical protein